MRSVGGLVDWSEPSEAARARFRALYARWRELEKLGVDQHAPVKLQREAWHAFRDDWLRGDKDVTRLQEIEIDAEVVRNTLPGASRLPKLEGGQLEDASSAFHAAAELDKTGIPRAIHETVDRAGKTLSRASDTLDWLYRWAPVIVPVVVVGGVALAIHRPEVAVRVVDAASKRRG